MTACRSHDNGRLVSGGADKVVILTDVGTGQPIRKFRGHMSVSSQILFFNISPCPFENSGVTWLVFNFSSLSRVTYVGIWFKDLNNFFCFYPSLISSVHPQGFVNACLPNIEDMRLLQFQTIEIFNS